MTEASEATTTANAQRVPVGDEDDRDEEERGEGAGNRAVDGDERADGQRGGERDGRLDLCACRQRLGCIPTELSSGRVTIQRYSPPYIS